MTNAQSRYNDLFSSRCSRLLVICLYQKIPEKFVPLFLQDRFKLLYFLRVFLIRNFSLKSEGHRIIGPVGGVFANGPGDLGSIPVRIIPQTFKIVLGNSLFNIQQYKVRIKGKLEQSGKGVAPSPTPRCCSYWKGSLLTSVANFTYLLLLLFTPWEFFFFSLSWWFFTGVWVTASLLRSQGLFSVFGLISIIQ